MSGPPNPPAHSIALVLGFDSKMFGQAQQCIESIWAHCRHSYHLCVVALDLAAGELQWLRDHQIRLFTDYTSLRSYPAAPRYAHAMTCRPYLPQIFPGYRMYMWIDADIRFLHPDAFDFYLGKAKANPKAVVICQEVDPTYAFTRNPPQARAYFTLRRERIFRTYGPTAADYLQYFTSFNTGVFAMHRDSPVWISYRRNLENGMNGKYDHMTEQDAMNIAIVEDGMAVVVAPTVMNWLCSVSMPTIDKTSGRCVRPEYPHLPISVLHLMNSFDRYPGSGSEKTFYEVYQQAGLVK